jgi:serine/threonine protein kinase
MLLGRSNEVLLSDFGLALIAQSSRSQDVQQVAGTITYMAPEQLQGKPRLASDQYALGIVVYEWLCGSPPFVGSFPEIASGHVLTPPPSLCEKISTLSPELEQVVLTALAKEPRKIWNTKALQGHQRKGSTVCWSGSAHSDNKCWTTLSYSS